MKKLFNALLLGLMAFALSACGTGSQEPAASASDSSAAEMGASSQPVASTEPSSADEMSYASSEGEEPGSTVRRISVRFGDNIVIYELNDGTAAASLYEQLPLTCEVENFSTNEKIFYPPQELDTSDSPLAQSGAGTLAYYAPWGDVVMFYGEYSVNSSLYELGQAVSGGELVSQMSGTITVTAVD